MERIRLNKNADGVWELFSIKGTVVMTGRGDDFHTVYQEEFIGFVSAEVADFLGGVSVTLDNLFNELEGV